MPQISLAPWQYAAVNNPFNHFAFYGGVAAGKSFTGSHFAIFHICHYPHMTGFIGANTYDQLSQASLREFFYWLDVYGLEYIVDKKPPRTWDGVPKLKMYRNTVVVRNPKTKKCTLIFTRVLSDENPLRGVQFSWYWLDETRDTPETTHDVILSRMRETADYAKGIITTTTNGEDWSFKRFVKGAKKNDLMYGSMHIPTRASLDLGIISELYYNTMLRSYSELLAQQELWAKHVNVTGGKAYYAAGAKNRKRRAPWGDHKPKPERPLIIGCDFNYSPAPFVWMIGQIGPEIFSGDGQTFYGDCIHWFDELSGVELSTQEMTFKLLNQYPGFFYRIFGDVSGGQGTTSNAGKTDYDQIAQVLDEHQAEFTIDYFQDDDNQNPRVKNRVENMNALFKNAMGEIRQTYNPNRCLYFDGDLKIVGWKKTTDAGRAKLDDCGDHDRTHATDGAGYAVFKLFPPGRRARIIESNESTVRQSYGLIE